MSPDDIDALRQLEWRADRLLVPWYPSFAGPEPEPADVLAARLAGADGWVATAGGEPAGYAAASGIGDVLWLVQLAVDPTHGRKGLGRELVEAAAAHARRSGCSTLMLSTFRDVPFNRPWYARLGFTETEPATLSPALQARFRAEIPAGIAAEERSVMARGL